MGEDSDNSMQDYNYSTEQSDYNSEEQHSVMKNFFDTETFLYRKEMEWKGFTFHNNKPLKTNRPIAPDTFINEMVGALRSIINQHSSVSFISKEKANTILWEKFVAFSEAVLGEPIFDEHRYSMIKEEFDHALELFMGLIINGHGTGVAQGLQAGVVNEMIGNKDTNNSQSIFDKAKTLIGGK